MIEHQQGFLLLNKPTGISSYDCIRALKKYLPKKAKIGHTGTLDDGASGILIICIGRGATKMVSSLMGLDKEYVVKAKLGELTDTLDAQGSVIESAPVLVIPGIDPGSNQDKPQLGLFTHEQVNSTMQSLRPSYNQVPPVYSALKHKGQPLYALARQQKMTTQELDAIVEQKARTVFIREIELLDYVHPFFTFRSVVSKGTYVRSVANDIATRLGTVATVYELCRTKVGRVMLAKTVKLEDIKSSVDLEQNLVSCDQFSSLIDG